MSTAIALVFLTVGPLVLALLVRELLFSDHGSANMSEKKVRISQTLMKLYLLVPLITAAFALQVDQKGIFIINGIILAFGIYFVSSKLLVQSKK